MYIFIPVIKIILIYLRSEQVYFKEWMTQLQRKGENVVFFVSRGNSSGGDQNNSWTPPFGGFQTYWAGRRLQRVFLDPGLTEEVVYPCGLRRLWNSPMSEMCCLFYHSPRLAEENRWLYEFRIDFDTFGFTFVPRCVTKRGSYHLRLKW